MSFLVCPECGKSVPEYVKICSNCGCKISVTEKDTISGEYCMINGVKCSKKELKRLIDNGGYIEFLMNQCSMTGRDTCNFSAVIKFNNNEIPDDYEECFKRYIESNKARSRAIQRYKAANAVKCPYCHSTNVKKITFTHWAFGRQWHCNSCDSDF